MSDVRANHRNATELPIVEPTPASSLPTLYASWIEEVLAGPIPDEPHATCLTCAMCKPQGQAATASAYSFSPVAKCCTYIPTLPNFLVGQVLADESFEGASGRASIEQRIAQEVGVTPLGLQPAPTYMLIYKYTADELFGRTDGLRCPHYVAEEGGLCGIWRHRNAVCSTWFCKLERGANGKAFWDALREFLTTVERQLALWCAIELGEGPEGLGLALVPYYGTLPSGGGAHFNARAVSQRNVWSPRWVSAQSAFYVAAARLVTSLSWKEIVRLCGPEVALQMRPLQRAYATLRADAIPEYLRLAPVGIVRHSDATDAVSGYSLTDMPILSNHLVDALFRFDGRRRTEDVLEEITVRDRLKIDETMIRQLVDFRILLPMPELTDSSRNPQ